MNTAQKWITGICAIIMICIVLPTTGIFFNYEKEAENYVKSQVYNELGGVVDRFDSDIIYKKGKDAIVEVKFYIDGEVPFDGVYCVHFRNRVQYGCTDMQMSGFDGQDHLEELKALFGI